MTTNLQNSARLSDRIYCALDLAIEQEDVAIAEILMAALEHAMTRNAGGGEFVERRHYPDELLDVIDRLAELKAAQNLSEVS